MLAVGAGGAIGAVVRVWLAGMLRSYPPTATLVVNIVGSFLAGLAIGLLSGAMLALVVTGLCGALTTFSTFANEVRAYVQAGDRLVAVAYAVITAVACLTAAGLGRLVV